MNTNTCIPWSRFRRDEGGLPARGRVVAFPSVPLSMELDRLFDGLFSGVFPTGNAHARNKPLGEAVIRPNLDISGDEKQYFVTVELPGVDENDLRVELEKDSLRIVGEKKDTREVKEAAENGGEGGRHFYRIERSYGSFERVLALPEDVDADAVTATHKDGVLTITLPRRQEERPESRRIDINRG